MPNTASTSSRDRLAVLISGGLDSAILLGDAIRQQTMVFPLFVRAGLYWEPVELAYLERFLHALACPFLQPLTILEMPVTDMYGAHWSTTGVDVPDAHSADEAVYLPGRNLLLLAKALVWCRLHDVGAVALGSLQTNPFPDATPAFFRSMEETAALALAGAVRIHLPFAGMKKEAVMALGQGMPLEHSFSCIRPVAGLHCGACNKCAERQQAFTDAGMNDPTAYHVA